MVKVGIYYAYWTQNWYADFIPFVEKVKKLGFDVLEVNGGVLTTLSHEKLELLRAVANDNGISLSCCIGLTDDVDPSAVDPATRKRGIEYLNHIADSMVISGIQKLSGIIYSSWPGKIEPRGYSKEQIRKWSIESMKEAIKKAEDQNLFYHIEVVNRFEQFIINTAQEAVEYLNEVGSTHLKILLDTFHMNIEENSFHEAILTAGEHLGHFHIGENNRRPPGVGMIPWDNIFAALRDISYNQWIIMEPFITPGGEIGRDISIYRYLMPNADKDKEAEKSCEFIKRKVKTYLC